METAKEIIHDSLPIKCLEAVIVALYLTVPLTNVQRFTLGFKSKCGDLYYRYTASLVGQQYHHMYMEVAN